MFVRLKENGARRYAYLVEGVSGNGRVRQKTLFYLGPFTKIALGIPVETRRDAERKLGLIDWNKVNTSVRKIPLKFEELEEIKRGQLATVYRLRENRYRNASRGNMPRAQGELSALTLLSRNSFSQMFEKVGQRRYRLR